MITFDNVSKVYPDGTVAVDDLDDHRPDRKDHHRWSARRAAARPRPCE